MTVDGERIWKEGLQARAAHAAGFIRPLQQVRGNLLWLPPGLAPCSEISSLDEILLSDGRLLGFGLQYRDHSRSEDIRERQCLPGDEIYCRGRVAVLFSDSQASSHAKSLERSCNWRN